jgi:plastocyanin
MGDALARGALALIVAALVAATLGAPAAPAGKKATTITVGNNFFGPAKKAVKRGTVVRFRWSGGVPHNVVKRRGPGKRFSSKTTSAAGVHFRRKFKRKGTYRIVCTIHASSMRLKLTVR